MSEQVPAKVLQKKLLGNLQSNGIIDALKAQLRYEVLAQIKAGPSAKASLSAASADAVADPRAPLRQRALNCVLAEYMQVRPCWPSVATACRLQLALAGCGVPIQLVRLSAREWGVELEALARGDSRHVRPDSALFASRPARRQSANRTLLDVTSAHLIRRHPFTPLDRRSARATEGAYAP